MLKVFSDKRSKVRRGRLPKYFAPHSAYLRGRLAAVNLFDAEQAAAILLRCDARSEAAFALGATECSDGPVLSIEQLDAALAALGTDKAAVARAPEQVT